MDINLFISMATVSVLKPDFNQQSWGDLNTTDRVYVTLRNPLSVASMEAAMPALLKKGFGENARFFQFHFQPFADVHFDVKRIAGGVIRPSLLWSLGLVGLFLVLAACINFINLVTAQALRERSRCSQNTGEFAGAVGEPVYARNNAHRIDGNQPCFATGY